MRRLSHCSFVLVLVMIGGAPAPAAANEFPPVDRSVIEQAVKDTNLTRGQKAQNAKPWDEYAPLDGATITGGGESGQGSAADGEYSLASVARRIIDIGNTGWASIRHAPGSFNIGNAKRGWAFDYVRGQSYNGYLYGYIGNSANVCAWILATQSYDSPGTIRRDCTNATRLKEADFQSVWNGNIDGVNCGYRDDGSRWCDGTLTTFNTQNCPNGVPAYANVQPWLIYGPLGEYLYTIPSVGPPNNSQVRWRYLTRDYNFVMVRDVRAGVYRPADTQQDWVFVPSYCISYYPGAQYPRTS